MRRTTGLNICCAYRSDSVVPRYSSIVLQFLCSVTCEVVNRKRFGLVCSLDAQLVDLHVAADVQRVELVQRTDVRVAVLEVANVGAVDMNVERVGVADNLDRKRPALVQLECVTLLGAPAAVRQVVEYDRTLAHARVQVQANALPRLVSVLQVDRELVARRDSVDHQDLLIRETSWNVRRVRHRRINDRSAGREGGCLANQTDVRVTSNL